MTRGTPEFDLPCSPLAGMHLLEAAAGTGKTYTMAFLVLRLLIEEKMKVGEILVLTYTLNATEELRDRIRTFLKHAIATFSGDEESTPPFRDLKDRHSHPEHALRLLQEALRDFDDAAIHTIHSFCLRLLTDHALSSGQPMGLEILPDDTMLLDEAVRDLWRRHVYDASPELVAVLIEHLKTFKKLRGIARILPRDPLTRVILPARLEAPPDPHQLRTLFTDAKAQWQQERGAIGEELQKLELKKNLYRSIPDLLESLDHYFAQERAFPLATELEKATYPKLRASLKKGATPPTHLFFHLATQLYLALTRFIDQAQGYAQGLAAELYRTLRDDLPQRKRQNRTYAFDDLLTELYRVIQEPTCGFTLRETLRKHYRAALIDEFQDTDPLQYEILRYFFDDGTSPMFLIGDPRQAIYSFRGADLFAYLTARKRIANIHTLRTNYRSTPQLVLAINAIFSHHPCPFVFPEIPFLPVRAVTPQVTLTATCDFDPAPLQCWYLSHDFLQERKATNKEQCHALIAELTAHEIARLLRAASRGEVRLGDRPLIPDDIAVLVRDRFEGQVIQRALRRLGVTSVFRRAGLLLLTDEAKECARILKAILEPHRSEILLAALATSIIGVSGSDIPTLPIEGYHERFLSYLAMWEETGFLPMFRALLSREGVRERLLGQPEGERRLTNVLHLSEILHGIETKERLTPRGLFKWLTSHLEGDMAGSEVYELRLESDQGAVTISTIHGSKGLEFPIVFCPYLWWETKATQGDKGTLTVTVHHEREEEGWRRIVTPLWGGESIPEGAWRESLAEGCRLVYVALTRAAHRCYLVWGNLPESGTSPLAYLLHYHGDTLTAEALAEAWEHMKEGERSDDLEAVAMAAEGALRLTPITAPAPLMPVAGTPPPRLLEPPTLTSLRERKETIASFTWFVTQGREEEEEIELEPPAPPPDDLTTVDPLFLLPQGARVGNAIHGILQRLDFPHVRREEALPLIATHLSAYGIDPHWQEALWLMVERLLATPLNVVTGTLSLATVTATHRTAELAFAFPLAHIVTRKLASLFPDPQFSARLQRLPHSTLQGYLKGSIDLVFRHQKRYYIIDWKTNHLGYSYDDYRPERLKSAMYDHFYPLQYHLYLLALHRYLRRHLPQYTYEDCVGGVFYLFLRGINPAIDRSLGIYEDRPSRDVIDQLEAYLGEGGDGH